MPKRVVIIPEVNLTFKQLKCLFITAPVLKLPDLTKQFIVEVDSSEVGLGAVLSQVHREPGRLDPCAFFSCKSNLVERNYDIGNRELLAVKSALEEWRHWLEGACQLFVVYTDYRNLEYIWQEICLNPCQVRWALYFTRFHFTVTYCPSPKHTKADVLS